MIVAPYEVFYTVVFANIVVLLMNYAGDYVSKTKIVSYTTAHSSWHVISVLKSLYVAYKLGWGLNS